MQVDVKTHDEKDVASARVFNTLKEKLDEAQLGSGNHLSVSAVLNLAEQEAIPTTADATAMTNFLGQVHAIIHDILWSDLITVKTTEFSSYNDYHTQMTACSAAATGTSAHTALNTAIGADGTSGSRATHNSCRATESTEECEYAGATGVAPCSSNGACTTAVSAAGTIVSASVSGSAQAGMHSQCTPPAVCDAVSGNCEDDSATDAASHAGANIASWESWFTTSTSTFNTWNTVTLTEASQQDCIDKRIEHRDQVNLCNSQQTIFEGHWCLFHCAVQLMCSTRLGCSDGVLSNYDGEIAAWNTASDLRARQSCILEHMMCLIQRLIDGFTDVSTCDSNGTDSARCQLIWGNVFVRPTAADVCTTSVGTDGAQGGVASFGVLAEPAPGDGGFHDSSNSGYNVLPANAGEGPITGCVAC
jgi:hypothetical protein